MKQYTIEEKKKCVEEYRKSNLSIAKYAEQNNIPHATFRRWVEKENEGKFGEVCFETNKTPIFNLVTDTIKIELKEGYNKSFLQGIMGVILGNDN